MILMEQFFQLIKVFNVDHLYVPTQSSLLVMVWSLQAANFIPNKCTPQLAKTNIKTRSKIPTKRISLKPLHSSLTTRLMWGTKIRIRKGRQHLKDEVILCNIKAFKLWFIKHDVSFFFYTSSMVTLITSGNAPRSLVSHLSASNKAISN